MMKNKCIYIYTCFPYRVGGLVGNILDTDYAGILFPPALLTSERKGVGGLGSLDMTVYNKRVI